MANKINLDVSERLDITCRKGDTFRFQITISNSENTSKEDLTLDKFSMQVRGKANQEGLTGLLLSTNPEQVSVDSGPDNPALPLKGITLTPGVIPISLDRGSNVVSSATYGVLSISVDANLMSDVVSGRYVYDIQRSSNLSGEQKTILQGNFTVNDDISEVGN
jgi:hypothetical protein